jgi:putative acetyltransferase
MEIVREDPRRGDVVALLTEHLNEMRATSPPESVHALDPSALSRPDVAFWTLREDDVLLGCGALQTIDDHHGEIKSMRTATTARRRGVAGRVLDHLLAEARARGWARLSLETGSQDFFAPARALYISRGFTTCGPFATYRDDPHSTFLTCYL